jgi:hypothetical protein
VLVTYGSRAVEHTYNGDLATKLVLDFARLDCSWCMLLDELEKVLDTHCGGFQGSIVLRVPCVFGAGVVRRQQLRWRLEKDDERGHHVRDACRDARNHGFLGLGAP